MAKPKVKASKEASRSIAKADNNNPSTNAQLAKICDQLRDVRELIVEDLDEAIEANDMRAVIELLELDDRAIEVMNEIGCDEIARVPVTDRFIGLVDRFTFSEETEVR